MQELANDTEQILNIMQRLPRNHTVDQPMMDYIEILYYCHTSIRATYTVNMILTSVPLTAIAVIFSTWLVTSINLGPTVYYQLQLYY